MKIPDKNTRLEVYRKTLDFIKAFSSIDNETYGLHSYVGLCLLLPCIWLNIHYLEDFKDEDGIVFDFRDTVKYFPEFGEYYKSGMLDINKRISILNSILCSNS